MLLKVFNYFKVNCKFTTYEEFIQHLNKPENEKFLKYVITDINSEKGFNYTSGITVDSSITDEFLNKVGFTWSIIDEEYLIRYFKSTNFMNL